jgi:preprotein translocase subunit YajC
LKIVELLAMAPPSSGGSGGDQLFSTLIMFALIIGIFYFLILRPQQKRQKERQKLLEAVKKGDRVITAGGLHATVAGLDEKTVLLEVAANVKMKFDRSAIATIIRETESKPIEPS